MIFEEQNIKGIFKVTLSPYIDNRGAFSRLFCEEEFAQAGIPFSCKQVNQSFTKEKGSFRGMHTRKYIGFWCRFKKKLFYFIQIIFN
jgi:dTDP-4-dehydrorhamnose 3,5-epimerase